MSVVPVLAVIFGPLAGAAAAVGAQITSNRRAESERKHALVLAERAQDHERRLHRSDLLLEKRGEVYVEVLKLIDIELEYVLQTPMSLGRGGLREYSSLSSDQLTDLQARIAAWGAPQVWDLVLAFIGARNRLLRSKEAVEIADAGDDGMAIDEAHESRDRARADAVNLFNEIRRTIQVDLEAL